MSGQLARAWGNERFGEVAPWEEACLAAEQHDIGMAEWDVRPTLNTETGLPHSFMEMPLDVHLELWSGAAEKLVAQSRYAALLVSMHGTALYEMRDLDTPEVRAFLADRRTEQERLLASLGLTREAVLRNQALLWAWDYLSLALCLDWPPTVAPGEIDIALEPAGEERVRVDPWPFRAPTVRVHCEGRLLTERFSDEEKMRAALADAPWLTLERELIPA